MKYDSIMCMMVDDSVKTKDGVGDIINYKGYKLEMVTPKDVVIYRNGKRIDLAFKYPKSFKEAKERIDKGEFDSKTIDHAIRSCDSREDDIADELFDALQQIGKRNINKNEAEFISEKFFDGKVSVDELMRIFNKYKKEYL